MPTPLQQLSALGTSVWLDFIDRDLMRSGRLQRLIDDFSVVGMTSNPTIFEKAIGGSALYDETIRLLGGTGLGAPAVFEAIAVEDIRSATDILRPIYDRTDRLDGYVSLEVSPGLALDSEATIAEARHLWRTVDRPNLFIKVPATSAGIPAIRQLIDDGINVNVTLIFSVDRYREVMESYLAGLESRAARGDLLEVASVASFFVSRVDTLVDSRLDVLAKSQPDDAGAILGLRGKAAVANARIAYQRFLETFGTARFARLQAQGARVQRPLWASTSTKNPAYRDVIYVEELAGPTCVNTMPLATIEAFQDHGLARKTVDHDPAGAQAIVDQLEQLGIAYDEVVRTLEDDGVRLFSESYDSMITTLARKRAELMAAA